MNEKEYRRQKEKILQNSHKGYDVFKRYLAQMGVNEQQMLKGFYWPEKNCHMQVYFDDAKDQWMIREVNPAAN